MFLLASTKRLNLQAHVVFSLHFCHIFFRNWVQQLNHKLVSNLVFQFKQHIAACKFIHLVMVILQAIQI